MQPRTLSAALAVAAAALVACGSGTKAPSGHFTAQLNGANEKPSPISTSGAGTADMTLDPTGTSVTWTITATGLTGNATNAHIHIGDPTVAGPVIVDFKAISPPPAGTSTTFSGTFTQTNIKNPTSPPLATPIATMDQLIAAIRAGNAYFNIHTATNPGGEIRGQLSEQ